MTFWLVLFLSATIICRQPKAAGLDAADPGTLCEASIRKIERQYGLPAHLLTAIGLTESGRADPATGRVRPWPWSVQANATSHYFVTKAEAISWVQDAQAHGIASIDVGCLQVNLHFHAQAFETLDVAFDPARNIDYAARFLIQLHTETGDWAQAVGFYHSRTATLAATYQQHVQLAMSGPFPASRNAQRVVPPVEQLALAWRATLNQATQMQAGFAGVGWDSLVSLPQRPLTVQRRLPFQLALAEPKMLGP